MDIESKRQEVACDTQGTTAPAGDNMEPHGVRALDVWGAGVVTMKSTE